MIAAAGIVNVAGCSNTEGPRGAHVSISGPLTVMVGDAVQLTTDVVGPGNANLYWDTPDFRVVQQLGPGQFYGVGAGSVQVKVSLQTMNQDGTLTTVAQDSSIVTVVPPPASNRPGFSQIESGELDTCALSADGSTYCWGNFSGYRSFAPRCEGFVVHELPRVCHSVPVKLLGFPQLKSLNVGTYSACGVTVADDGFCWGIGPNNPGSASGNPAPVPGSLKFKTLSVETGYPLNYGSEVEHVCGITSSGQLSCWTRGGSPTSPSVMPGTNFASVSVGGVWSPNSDRYRACALDVGGSAYCWGTQPLGDGLPAPSSEQTTPVAVGGQLRFMGIASESYSTCALSTDGQPYCWGGPANPILTPTPIQTTLRFTAISAGAVRFCAIATDQAVYCWNESDPQPNRIGGSYHFRSVSVGGAVTCGLTTEGPEVCWGGKGMGGVGDGVLAPITTTAPDPVAGQRIWQ